MAACNTNICLISPNKQRPAVPGFFPAGVCWSDVVRVCCRSTMKTSSVYNERASAATFRRARWRRRFLYLSHTHTATDADSSRAALIVGETAPAQSVRREMLRLRTLRLTASRCYDGKMAGPWGPGWINGVGPDETGPDVRVRRLQPELNRWLRSVGQQTICRFMLPLDTTCNILSGIRIGISL